MIKIKDSHTTQPQLRISEQKGNMPQCGYLMHNKMMSPISSMDCLQLKNLANIDIPNRREKPNASKSILHKRKHSNDYTSTNIQKSVQVKTVKDNV